MSTETDTEYEERVAALEQQDRALRHELESVVRLFQDRAGASKSDASLPRVLAWLASSAGTPEQLADTAVRVQQARSIAATYQIAANHLAAILATDPNDLVADLRADEGDDAP